jgi:hypothetical protein
MSANNPLAHFGGGVGSDLGCGVIPSCAESAVSTTQATWLQLDIMLLTAVVFTWSSHCVSLQLSGLHSLCHQHVQQAIFHVMQSAAPQSMQLCVQTFA